MSNEKAKSERNPWIRQGDSGYVSNDLLSGDFRSEFLCKPSLRTPEEEYFHRLAWEYHERAEANDRQICSKRRGPVAVPANGYELKKVNIAAKRLLEEIVRREGRQGDTEFQMRLRREISSCARDFERSLKASDLAR